LTRQGLVSQRTNLLLNHSAAKLQFDGYESATTISDVIVTFPRFADDDLTIGQVDRSLS